MPTVIAVLYLLAVVALAVAWLLAVADVPKRDRLALVLLAGTLALLAYSLPAMQAGFH